MSPTSCQTAPPRICADDTNPFLSINKNGEIIDLQKLIIGDGYRPRRRIDNPTSEIDVF